METKALKRIVAFLSFSLLVISLASCGDDDEGAGNAGNQGPSVAGSGGEGTSGEGEPDGAAPGDGGPADAEDRDTAMEELDYSDDTFWLCKPGAADNPCEADVSATELLPDNTLGEPIVHTVKQDADFDCFYVYPTVGLDIGAGNQTDQRNNADVKAITELQAARFSTVCRLYAPYYRQMKIGSYLMSSSFQTYFDFAYKDVTNAFDYYLDNYNEGRDIVLMGHSQGSLILTRLVSERFDNDPEMRRKLISALLVGTTDLFVPAGEKVGGTFQNTPLCSSDSETGCAVVYNSVSAPTDRLNLGPQRPPDGQKVACVNPANPGGGAAGLSSYVKVESQPALSAVTTPYALYRDFFTGECTGGDSVPALLVKPAPLSESEARATPFDFSGMAGLMSIIGMADSLHSLDYDLTIGNLVDLVKSQSAARH